MLDPWIIEEILRREEEQRRREERRIEIPLESPRRDRDPAEATPPTPDREERGVVIIDI
ncbi:MAG: hypothetical protein HS111_34515 [Kofleriaceae bacterium]|nr:hypothetical protein [Kofleriaceae bacterium]MCL4225073.1 hypothetical protein [Myxococcales bacterium]